MASSPVDKATLEAAMRTYLTSAGVNADSVSFKSVRKALGPKLSAALKAEKAWGRAKLVEIYNELEADDEGGDDEDMSGGDDSSEAGEAEPKPKGKSGYMRELKLSAGLATLFGVDRMQRSEATKRLWKELKSKERGLQKNKKGAYVLDDELQRIFNRKTLAFKTISKALSAQLYDTKYAARGSGWNSDESEEEPEVKRVAKKKRKASGAASAGAGKKTKTKKPRKSGGGGGGLNKPQILSADMAAFMGQEEAARPQIVKALWVHIKANSLQREEDKRAIDCDDTLKKLLGQDSVTMFTMNKYIGQHLLGPGKTEYVPPEGAARKPKKPRKKRAGGASGGLNKPQKLSSDMAEFVGQAECSRPQVVKALWAHIKANNLQREEDKRTIDCDDTLKKLLGQDSVTMFTMNKYIGQHFIKQE